MTEYEPFVKQVVRLLREDVARRGDYIYVRTNTGDPILTSTFCDLVDGGDPVTTAFLDHALSSALHMVHLRNVPREER